MTTKQNPNKMPRMVLPKLKLPMMGYVWASFPSPAEGSEEQALNIHEFLVRHPAATFLYEVEGDELVDDNIRRGTVLVVDRSLIDRDTVGRLVMVEDDGQTFFQWHRRDKPISGRMIGVVIGNFSKC